MGDIVVDGEIVAHEKSAFCQETITRIYIIRVSNLKESKIIKVAIK